MLDAPIFFIMTRDTWHVTRHLSECSVEVMSSLAWVREYSPTATNGQLSLSLPTLESNRKHSTVQWCQYGTRHLTRLALGLREGVNNRKLQVSQIDQSIKKQGLYLRKNGFSRFQWLSMDRKKQGQMPIGCSMHMHATANEKALVLVSEWVSPSACHWHRLKPGTLPRPKSVNNYIFTLLTLLAVNRVRLGDNRWETECCADPRRWLIE